MEMADVHEMLQIAKNKVLKIGVLRNICMYLRGFKKIIIKTRAGRYSFSKIELALDQFIEHCYA